MPRDDAGALERVAPATFIDWKKRTRSFALMGAVSDGYAGAHNVTGVKAPERLRVPRVTGGFFSMLGVNPALGRELQAAEVRPESVLLISHRSSGP